MSENQSRHVPPPPRGAGGSGRQYRPLAAAIVIVAGLAVIWIARDRIWPPEPSGDAQARAGTAGEPLASDKQPAPTGESAPLAGGGSSSVPRAGLVTPDAGATGTTAAVEQVIAQRDALDRTVWAKEVEAQQHERTLIGLWDALRAAPDPFQELAEVPFQSISLGKLASTESRDLDITIEQFSGPGETWTREQWKELVGGVKRQGYQIEYTEWHHSKFDHPAGEPAKSSVSFGIHVRHPQRRERIIVKGTLGVVWSNQRDQSGNPLAATVDASDVQLIRRMGPPAFQELAIDEEADPARSKPTIVAPAIVYDLNGDGLSEILLGGSNRLYWNLGDGKFQADKIADYRAEDMLMPGVVADFSGDGLPDFMCFLSDNGHLRLFPGTKGGRFGEPLITAPEIRRDIRHPIVLSAGDIDGDGDLDLFVGQYKVLHHKGQMPTPYYDANDGYPAFVLRNDGRGNFRDVTEEVGLTEKRHRRTFSASLVDLDEDRDLDLLVVSDFAGVDVYHNDGRGRFTDVTEQVMPVRNTFGMSHTFADYDLDGRLDFYVIGMSSTTARRLDHMGLGREDFRQHHEMRKLMGYGNRMYLTRGDQYQLPAFAPQIARTGWSWGSTSLDFDNDGDRDLYVGNGLRSGESCQDYCTNYWRHDIYTGNSQDDPTLEKFFSSELQDLMGGKTSWNGYENNALLMNLAGRDFLNVAYLMGVASVYDSRCVISDDLDGDGRQDLLVVEEIPLHKAWGGQALHVYRNQWPQENHWIGLRLREAGAGCSPVGAKVTLRAGGRTQVHQIVTGDSHLAQHATTVHFGLGRTDQVERLEVRWPNGHVQQLRHPPINRYHEMTPTR